MNIAGEIAITFIGPGLTYGALKLRDKDANDTGADDAFAQVMLDLAPIVPTLIAGNPGDNAADKTMLALLRTAYSYLQARNKLPAEFQQQS